MWDDSISPETDRAWISQRVGTRVGPTHRIVRHLASGGMGHVFLAEHVTTGAYAAAKFCLPGGEVPVELLDHEAAVLDRLDHPHIVKNIGGGYTCDGVDYLLLEYVPGIDLETWLTRAVTPMREPTLLAILQQLASAVDHLHACGLVHSDIKPANVMFDPNVPGSLKLLDFGLAFERRDASLRSGSAGTPGYMAPEQLRGQPCGPAIDRFAVAAMAFELLTGCPLQPWATLSRVRAHAQMGSAVLADRKLLSAQLEQVFERALHDRPEQRYPSATAFVLALREAIERDAARKQPCSAA